MEWLTYLLKVSTCLGLFYALYHFFFQKLTFFSLNRFYLLSTMLLSFLIPVLQVQLKSDAPQPLATVGYTSESSMEVFPRANARPLPDGQMSASLPIRPVVTAPELNWVNILGTVYFGVALTILLVLLLQVATLLWYSRKVVAVVGPLKIVQKTGRFTNCSFLNYVFIDQQELDEDILTAVMHHESVHAARYHSADKILLGICKALLWFSPPIYFFGRALEQTHEYEADKETSSLLGNTIYANLLLTLAVSSRHAPLVHSFVKNPVKERIKMLFTNQSKNMKKLTYLSFVPAGLALLWLFGVQIVYAEIKASAADNLSISQKLAVPRSIPLSAALTGGKEAAFSKQPLPATKEEPDAQVRLIDNVELGENPAVFIDGKEYPCEILTRISPACMSLGKFSYRKAEISTWKNEITYATKAEIETAKIRIRMKAQGRFYSRYPVTLYGHKQDEILVRFGTSFAQASFPKGYRIALSIDGEIFSEKQALKMSGNPAYNVTGINYGYTKDDPELFSKYGDQYDLILQFENEDINTTRQRPGVTRGSSTVISESGDEKFEYRATDSVVYSKDKQYITLFGNAKIINGKRSTLNGDKIQFDAKTRTAIVQNASVTFQGRKNAVECALLKIDIDQGTYEVLSGMPDF